MNPFLQRHWFKLLITAVFFILVATFMLRLGGGKESMPVLKPAQDFRLSDADGKSVGLADFDGKVRAVYFFYSSCPDVCYPTNHMLSQVQEELAKQGVLGSDAMLLSISFDPDRDTGARLKEYAKSMRADPKGWVFLRGEEKTVAELAQHYGVGVIKGNDGNFAHQNVITLVDRKGNIRKFINAANLDVKPAEIAKSIRQLTEESAK